MRSGRPLEPAERRWGRLLLPLLVIGGLALGGWLLGWWLSPDKVPASQSGPVLATTPAAAQAVRSPENPQIAAMRSEALGVLAELEHRFPDDPAVLCSIGSLYALYALDDEAKLRWDRSIRLAPNSAGPYNSMGCSALVRGDYEEAIG